MRRSFGRVLLFAAGLAALTGCATTSGDNPFVKVGDAPKTSGHDNDPTGSVFKSDTPPDAPKLNAEVLGEDPNDELSIGKKYYRQGSYGLAEQQFRKAAEHYPRDVEAWIGLAAAYDRLKRFDLADRAYDQAIKLTGSTPEVMNNQGFSYMLRGDYRRARTILLAARVKDPNNAFIANNLALLDAAERKKKAVN